jgi:hypothetical protein
VGEEGGLPYLFGELGVVRVELLGDLAEDSFFVFGKRHGAFPSARDGVIFPQRLPLDNARKPSHEP